MNVEDYPATDHGRRCFFVNENHRPCRWFQKALAMQRKKCPPLVLWVWFANRTHNTKEESSLDET